MNSTGDAYSLLRSTFSKCGNYSTYKEITCITHKLILENTSPNVVDGWLALLLRIREVSDSNLDPETGYSD
jgi:hypothetical protein